LEANLLTQAVELTEAERAILTEIKMDAHLLDDHIDATRNGTAVCKLMRSLISRQAIPEVRRLYFQDPEYNIGRRKSRRAYFESNSTLGERIFQHPHFLPYFRYFLERPQLPATVLESFRREVLNCGDVTSGDIILLGDFARQQARSHDLDPMQASEEFYKLALECNLDLDHAGSLRDAVRRMR
jgi:hypothetical protein